MAWRLRIRSRVIYYCGRLRVVRYPALTWERGDVASLSPGTISRVLASRQLNDALDAVGRVVGQFLRWSDASVARAAR